MDNLINLIFSAILVLIEENKEKDTKGETDEHQTSAILDEYIRKMLTESQDILSKEL